MDTFSIELLEKYKNEIFAVFLILAVRTILRWYSLRYQFSRTVDAGKQADNYFTGILRYIRWPDNSIKYIRPLGTGVTGTVFLARQKINGKWTLAAIKSIPLGNCKGSHSDELLKVFRTMQKLSDKCPFILQILHGEHIILPSKRIMLSTEYCEGGSLRSLAEKGQMHYVRLYDCAVQVLRALEYLHENNIIHRDIKGDNVLLTRKGVRECIKLGDFDFSKVLARTSCNVSSGVGTVEFMAPEVIQGEAGEYKMSRKVDVWSFGCMVVELIGNGRIGHFRRKNGTVFETQAISHVTLAWEIANGAVPEVCIGNVVMSFTYYSGLLELCWRAVYSNAREPQSSRARIRPSASDLLKFATYKVSKSMEKDGFPNVIGFSDAPMMLLQMWVRDRVLEIRQDVYLLDPAELECCQEILQTSLRKFREGPRNAGYDIYCSESEKQLSEKRCQCTLSLLLVGRMEIFPTGESAVSVKSPDEYSAWCHYVSAQCVLSDTDPLNPEDILNFISAPRYTDTKSPHRLPASTWIVGVFPTSPQNTSEYELQIQAILRTSYRKHEGTMQKFYKICSTKYATQYQGLLKEAGL